MSSKEKKFKKMITVPVVMTRTSDGKTKYENVTMPLKIFEDWLKGCYEMAADF